MLLTELVETLTTHLNDNKSLWTQEDITVTSELDATPDPTNNLLVYVMPQAIQPIVEGAMQRGRQKFNKELLIVSLVLAKNFTELVADTTMGVANWTTEIVPIINTWQRTQEVLMKYQIPSLTLSGVEPSPPSPIKEDLSVYAVMTTFSYEQVVCDSAHELSLLSIASNEGITLQEIRDSIKSQPSSD